MEKALDYGAMIRRRGVQKQNGKLTLGESTSTLKAISNCGLKRGKTGRGGGEGKGEGKGGGKGKGKAE
jgi:hypothetical protein